MNAKPNILFLQNDHQAYYRHGWDGGIRPQTPHFDRLASGGARFERAYTVVPLCGPARRSMLTGLFPHTHGQFHNYTDPPYTHDVYLDALAASDYRNFYYGKWHAGPGSAHDHGCQGFSYTDYGNPYITPEYHDFLKRRGLPEPVHRIERAFWIDSFRESGFFDGLEEGAAYRCASSWCGEHAWGITETPKETHESFFLASLACERLEALAESGDKPFSMRVDFWGPHQPYFPTREFADMYDPTQITEYGSFRSGLKGKPEIYWRERNHPIGKDNRLIVPNQLEWSEWQQILARCYGHISMIDAAGGMILDRLEELGLADNTLVIWAADHGDAIASHGGHFDKSSYISEEVARIPLAMRLPGHISPGQCRSEFVSNIDIPATIMDAANLGFSEPVHGRTLFELFADDGVGWRDDLMTESYGHGYGEEKLARMLVHGTFKYIWNRDDIDELYDLEEDPYELTNLTDDPVHTATLAEMRRRLKRWQSETNDPEIDQTP